MRNYLRTHSVRLSNRAPTAGAAAAERRLRYRFMAGLEPALAATAARLGLTEDAEGESRPAVDKIKGMLNARFKIEITDG